jgi:phage tail sheath protein FI
MQFLNNGGHVAWVVRVGGEHEARDGLAAFDGLDPAPNLVCLPGWVEEEILGAAVSYCDLRRAFLVADPPGADLRAAMDLAGRLAEGGSSNAAVCFPRFSVADPVNGGRPRWCPPSGSVAGVIARTDMERGVFASPADAVVTGALGLEVEVTDQEAGRLDEAGVTAIRSIPLRGIRVWGGRTVSSPSGEWKYVSVRRLALYLEESLDRGLQWAVFEPNDEPLWIQVRQSVARFQATRWRSGGLQGSTEQEAFFVRCGRGVMTKNDLDNGRLVALVGFAPLKPAEFLLLRITVQTSASTT